jgi:hypothetical protein
MQGRSAANFLKWFTRRVFCMVVLRFSAGKEPASAKRSAPPGASTAASRVRKSVPRHSAPCATAIYQINVIRTHIRQRDPLLEKGPPPRCPLPKPTGNACAITQERNVVAKDNRLFLGQESPTITAEEITGEIRLRQWRHRRCQAARPFCWVEKAGNCRGLVTSHLRRQFVI